MSTTQSNNTFTTVKTSYARAVLLLLALNFCLTAYVVLSMNQATQEQIDGVNSAATSPVSLSVKPSVATAPPATTSVDPSVGVNTRESKPE